MDCSDRLVGSRDFQGGFQDEIKLTDRESLILEALRDSPCTGEQLCSLTGDSRKTGQKRISALRALGFAISFVKPFYHLGDSSIRYKRVCGHDGCETFLSVSNRTDYCSLHEAIHSEY